jgi:hypothetical protein
MTSEQPQISPEEVERYRAWRAKEDAQKLAAERAEIEKIRAVNQKIFADDALNRALDGIGIRPELKRGAYALHRGKVKVISDDTSDYGMRGVIQVGDAQLGIEEYLQNWAGGDPEAAAYLQPSMRPGRKRQWYRSEMSALQKSQYIREHGIELYNKLPLKPNGG